MRTKLHIDIETYSSVDIKTSGAYKYAESIDFEILLVAYAFNNEEIKIVDLAQGETLPEEFIRGLRDSTIEKHAHSANFERRCFIAVGYHVSIEQWHCSAIKAGYCGLPLSLGEISKALGLGDKGKLKSGTALIRFFCIPCKPSKVNGQRHRNLPKHDLVKWEEFKLYCIGDVVAEREIDNILIGYKLPSMERRHYILDQQINDRGILIDTDFAQKAIDADIQNSAILRQKMKALTGLENPNSPAQLKEWLGEAMGKEITSLAKDTIPALMEEAGEGAVSEVLKLRLKTAKSSVKKYAAMINCACDDNRAHGLFQFYGGSRTGRWAGRLIQMQNLPQNHLPNLQGSRDTITEADFESTSILYDDISSLLSQLIRTAFIADHNLIFAVADFSAIEARVIAWLAGEEWRMEVFRTHGKIYEASAAMMFKIPIELVTKGSEFRAKGKIAELALGYQGAKGALTAMGGEDMGLSGEEMDSIVKRWRNANKKIVALWGGLDKAALAAFHNRTRVNTPFKGVFFEYNGEKLMMGLPSGRMLMYHQPSLKINKWGKEALQYWGMDQTTKQWVQIDTYGGKLAENLTQAVARDLLAFSMLGLDDAGYKIVMHVHDEAVCSIKNKEPEAQLEEMCRIMGISPDWAEGLPLVADGYITPFYKKD